MREEFVGWYPRTAEELRDLWDRAIFVPDANILLHCLRHTAKVRGELLRVLEVLKDALWIPYQVGMEFQRNRLDVEFGAQEAYDRLVGEYESALGQAREKLRQLRAHPVISVDKEIAALDTFIDDFKLRMAEAKGQHPSEALTDGVNRLTTLFAGRVGPKPTRERMEALKKEGDDRYARKVPPGYKDAKKDAGDLDKYGDLIIWKDLIAKAKADERPIIFISDDAKEDWWRLHKGRKIGPRPELVEEFQRDAGQDFHIYEFGHFLRIAAERHPEIPKESIDEIERSLRVDDEARRRQVGAVEAATAKARLTDLEAERDTVISALAGVPGYDLGSQGERPDKASLRQRLADIDVELRALRDSASSEPPTSETTTSV